MDNVKEIKRIFKVQSEPSNILRLRNSSLRERIEKIKRIENFISNDSNHQIIAKALYKDLRKSNEEVITTEITPYSTKYKASSKKFKTMDERRVCSNTNYHGGNVVLCKIRV